MNAALSATSCAACDPLLEDQPADVGTLAPPATRCRIIGWRKVF
jgi:hypothetical protein